MIRANFKDFLNYATLSRKVCIIIKLQLDDDFYAVFSGNKREAGVYVVSWYAQGVSGNFMLSK
ncbi:MAG: hypothetical protein ACE5JB_10765 [bacterium]